MITYLIDASDKFIEACKRILLQFSILRTIGSDFIDFGEFAVCDLQFEKYRVMSSVWVSHFVYPMIETMFIQINDQGHFTIFQNQNREM